MSPPDYLYIIVLYNSFVSVCVLGAHDVWFSVGTSKTMHDVF